MKMAGVRVTDPSYDSRENSWLPTGLLSC
jgi:hypothetical protein